MFSSCSKYCPDTLACFSCDIATVEGSPLIDPTTAVAALVRASECDTFLGAFEP